MSSTFLLVMLCITTTFPVFGQTPQTARLTIDTITGLTLHQKHQIVQLYNLLQKRNSSPGSSAMQKHTQHKPEGATVINHNTFTTDSFNVFAARTNDTLSLTITDTGSTPADMYFSTVYDDDTSMLFYSKETFYQYIEAAGSDQLSRIRRLAYIVKSDRFQNNYLSFMTSANAYGNQLNQYESIDLSVPMFALSNTQQQCGQYRDFCIKVLIETGTVSPDSIFQLSLTNHQLAVIILNGDSAVLDPDPGEPTFLNVDSNGHFLSPSEIAHLQNNPIGAGPIYTYCDPIDGQCNWMIYPGGDAHIPDTSRAQFILDSEYVSLFPGYQYNSPPSFVADADSGFIRLPAHSSLRFHATMGYVLTTVQADTLSARLQHATTNTDIQALLAFLDSVFNINDSIRTVVFNKNELMHQQGANDLVLDGSYDKWNTVQFEITTGNDTVFFGKDLRGPFLVHSITTTLPVQFRDTVVFAGQTRWYLWDEKGEDVDTNVNLSTSNGPETSLGMIEKLQDGGFIPPHDTVTMELYYNQRMFPFVTGTYTHVLSGNADSLLITSYQTSHSIDVIDTSTNAVNEVPLQTIGIYPNPTNGSVTISGIQTPQKVIIYDCIGREIVPPMQYHANTITFSLAPYASGVYLVKIEQNTFKVVKN